MRFVSKGMDELEVLAVISFLTHYLIRLTHNWIPLCDMHAILNPVM